MKQVGKISSPVSTLVFEATPLNLISVSDFLKIPGTIFASLTVSLINCSSIMLVNQILQIRPKT